VGRLHAGRCLLDLIAIEPRDDRELIDAILAVPH
jgi:hypothetical protein